MRRFIVLFLVLLFLTACLGCANGLEKKENTVEKNSYAVQDYRGKSISFEGKPQRIVSLFVYGDEVLLGLVDHKRIAGLSKWVHDADLSMGYEDAKDVPQIAENNPEAILALKPDLVLMPSGSKPEQIGALEDLGIKVFVYPAASSLKNISVTIKYMGDAVGERKQAEKLISDMQQRISVIEAKTKKMRLQDKKKALLFLRFGAVGGRGIIFNDIMTAAGIEDCYEFGRSNYFEQDGKTRILSKEEVVQANPDYLLLGSWSQGGVYKTGKEQLAEIYADPALATITAVKKKQVIMIPQRYVHCLSQHAADSVELLHEAVYGK